MPNETPQGEVWRPVVGYEGRYEVSTLGRVKSLMYRDTPRKTPVIMRVTLLKGYCRVLLSHGDGAWKSVLVHRLVLTAWRGKCPDGYECAHLDGNRQNNRPENLAWTTRKENHAHMVLHGTRMYGEKNAAATFTKAKIVEIRNRYAAGGVTYKQLAVEYGTPHTYIGEIIRGRRWSHV